MSLQLRTTTARGPITISSEPLGRGGEGSVYAVTSHGVNGLIPASQLVAKIYHNPNEGNRQRKVEAMLKAVPETDSVAWPLGTVYEGSQFKGYVMVKLDTKRYKTWAELAHNSKRKKTSPGFDVRYAMTACMNLAIALDSVHRAGHCVGDVNESNILVGSDARVMIVDTDSAQVKDPSGEVFHCPVGKPEYTAPELTHGKLKDQDRTPASDMFAYCVAMFQMLSGGANPTNAVYSGDDDPPSVIEKIRNGWFPGILETPSNLSAPPRVPTKYLPLIVRNVLAKGLAVDPKQRPSFSKVIAAESSVAENMVQCDKHELHWYDKREKSCPWCKHRESGQFDPWSIDQDAKKPSGPSLKQTALPAVGFSDGSTPTENRPRRTQITTQSGGTGLSPFAQGAPTAPPLINRGVNAPGGSRNQQAPQQAQQPQQGQQQAPQTPQSQSPKKKRGKTVVRYADGTYGPRPSLYVVAQQSPKMAAKFFFDELPEPVKPYWSGDRSVATITGLILVFLIGGGLSASWFLFGPQFAASYSPSKWWLLFTYYGFMAASITSSLATLALFISGLIDRIRTKKQVMPNQKMIFENFVKTGFGAIVLTLFWGPLLVVGAVGGIVFGILKAIFTDAKSQRRRMSR